MQSDASLNKKLLDLSVGKTDNAAAVAALLAKPGVDIETRDTEVRRQSTAWQGARAHTAPPLSR
jgi:hypothetical protein